MILQVRRHLIKINIMTSQIKKRVVLHSVRDHPYYNYNYYNNYLFLGNINCTCMSSCQKKYVDYALM